MKKLILLLLLLSSPAQANVLQIREAQAELHSLKAAENQHYREYAKAKAAYEKIRSARRQQENACKALAKADSSQRNAEGLSREFHLYKSNAYEQDNSMARGGISYYREAK